MFFFFFFSSRRRHTRLQGDWSSDVCSSDLLYRKMRVLDVLVFLGEMKGIDRRRARQRAGEWLERLGLAQWRLRRVDELSKGMQQKGQFISTLLPQPDLPGLDEIGRAHL